MPRIIIKAKGLTKAQGGLGITTSTTTASPYSGPPLILNPSFLTTTTTSKPPIPYAGAVINPDEDPTNPSGKNFDARKWIEKGIMTNYSTSTTTKGPSWAQKTQNKLNRFYSGLDDLRGPLAQIDAYKRNRRAQMFDREAGLPDNYLAVGQQSAPGTKGDYDINTGMFGDPKDHVANKGQTINPTGFLPERGFYNRNAQYGGEQGMKIRITGLPNQDQMAYGGQARHSLDIRRDALSKPNITYDDPYEVNNTLQPVPRDEANLEAEKDETVFGDIDGDGGFEHFKVGGKRHTQGGTPLNLPEGSFVFSDTAKMKIKDPEVLGYFGLKPKKGGFTPAEIAKRYDINRYKAILENPEADEISKNTAQQMINNYNKKLAYLALIQESMKGFPQGIPEVAQKILGLEPPEEQMAASEDEEMAMQMGQQPQMEQQPSEEEMMMMQQQQAPQQEVPQEEAGQMFSYGGESQLMKYQPGGPFNTTSTTTLSGTGSSFNPNPNYQYTAQTSGKLDYSSPNYAGGIWSGNRYSNEWIPLVKNTLSDQAKFDMVVQALDNYSGPDAADVKSVMARARKSGDLKGKILDLSTDTKVGPFHNAVHGALNLVNTTTSTTTQGPAANVEKLIGWKCDPNTNVVTPKEYNSEAELKADGAVASSERMNLPCSKPGEITPGKQTNTPYGPLWPDVRNYYRSTMFPPRNYSAAIKGSPYAEEQVFLRDPRQQLAENQSLQNAAMQALSTTGDVRSLNSITPGLQGQSLANASKIVDQVQGQNVDILNDWAKRRALRQQEYNQYSADLATQRPLLSKDMDVFNLNAQRAFERGKGLAETNLFNNMMKMGLMNSVNQRYYIDPRTGRTVFKSGYGPGSLAGGSNFQYGTREHYLEMKSKFPTLDEKTYFEMGKDFPSKNNDVDPYAPYYNFYNPMVPS
jgi:hypothetical protein